MAPFTSPNFAFLDQHDVLLVKYGAQAERYFADDPNTSLIKLRQFAELLAGHAASLAGVYTSSEDGFVSVLNRLWDRGVLTPEVSQLFHGLRKAGNAAVHDHDGTRREAFQQLKMARKLGVWFHQGFGGDPRFKPGPFIAPPDPQQAEEALRAELAAARQEAVDATARAAQARLTAEEQSHLRAQAEAEARAAYEEVTAALELAQETEAQLTAERGQAARRMADQQAATEAQQAADPVVVEAVVDAARAAGASVNLTEAETRKLIDAQLREAGWEVDTEQLRHARGTRPAKGRTMAISEWPTASGPADYVLFVGLTPIAVVEAKRDARNVEGAITQAKRYSRDFVDLDAMPAGGPWAAYKLPFLFATNGRPFLRQLIDESGIWFLDARVPTNHSRALEGWYTPEGLTKLLRHDATAASAKLKADPKDYLPLRDYQRDAITAVETAIDAGQRAMLLAMATGTGKTRTCICLVYRLIKAGRFRRVLFLVDRTSLGDQAHESFKSLKLEAQQGFTDIYDVKGLTDVAPDADTRLHLATVQGMVRRLISDDGRPIPVDEYDCIVIDECHRGYNVDRELSATEFSYRSEDDYISKYRRVLDHFDAVKVGLTATPALHTTEIFGKPVYTYSYRQAVIDGFLVDHEPPTRIVTALAEDGITWGAGEEMAVYKPRTGQLDLVDAPDEVTIEIEGFNKRVLTENFNRVVCEVLAANIDPDLPGKTLVFAATDKHADMLVRLLKEAFTEAYGEIDDDAVVKITGAADKPRKLLRHYKNERNPRIVVTVDLLTTGIDVPAITNLVFIRRVRSRILYEQMLGRATRLCPDIGKLHFRVFDAVDLYAALEDHTTMTPVVPKTSFTELVGWLETLEGEARDEVYDQLVAKFQRKKRSLVDALRSAFVERTGMAPEELSAAMKEWGVDATRSWWMDRKDLAAWLDALRSGDGPTVLISGHDDTLRSVTRGYGEGQQRPEDYLDAFGVWVAANMNEVAALRLVTQRPRDLTRAQLRELKLALDKAGFSEIRLRTAWRDATNQDIAASIIGFVRQKALGSPLLPYVDRVKAAMATVLASRRWTAPQRRWLERIGKQLLAETVVDRTALDAGQFKQHGGFNRMNKVFGGELESVLGEINEAVWG